MTHPRGDLKRGDRVRPSRLAYRAHVVTDLVTDKQRRAWARGGTVAATPHDPTQVSIRWDGYKTVQRWHRSFLKKLTP